MRQGGLSGVAALAVCCVLLPMQIVGRETCTSLTRPVLVQEGAQAFISGTLGFSHQGAGGYGCGQPAINIMPAYEAMRWALGRLNQDSGTINGEDIVDSYIPGVKIGMYVEDSCEMPDIATRSVSDLYPQLYYSKDDCSNTNNNQLSLGVIGASISSVSQSMASLLSSFEIPQISFSSTASSLSDTAKYPYFMRTVPSDRLQVEVMLDVAVELGWAYMAVVYTDDSYGTEGYHALRNAASTKGVCLISAIPLSAITTNSQDFQDVYHQLLQTQATAVFYFGSQSSAKRLLQAGLTVTGAGKYQWMFPDSVGTSPEIIKNLNYARGIITISPATRSIAEFEDHWVSINESDTSSENPWFKDWYMTVNRCKLPGIDYTPYNGYSDCVIKDEATKRAEYNQNQYVEPAVTAIFAYARALRNAHSDICGRTNTGVCSGLIQMSSGAFYKNYLETVDFTFTREERVPTLSSSQAPYNTAKRVQFDSNGDIMNPSYDVWSYNNFDGKFSYKKAGTYINGKLDLNKNRIVFYDDSRQLTISAPISPCPNNVCNGCLTGSGTSSRYGYVKGDINIGITFGIHGVGETPFDCGSLSGPDVLNAEAFLYALEKISTINILPGIKIGGLMIDDCSGITQAVNTLSNFLKGDSDFTTSSGIAIDPRNVHAYIASSGDATTLATAELLTEFATPQLSYWSQNTILTDQTIFPYLAMVPPSDRQLADTIVKLLNKFSWSYIQIIYEDNKFGEAFKNVIKEATADADICVAAEHPLSMNYSKMAIDVASNKNARVLIVNFNPIEGVQFLKALNGTPDAGKYIIIPQSAWSQNPGINKLLPYLKPKVLTVEISQPVFRNFQNYLRSLTPITSTNNPWFMEWYESSLKCYIDPNDPKGYEMQCSNIANTPIASAFMDGTQYTSYVINSVYAIARGIDATLKQYCGELYNSICSEYQNADDRAQALITNIRQVSFDDEVGGTFKLSADGGQSGFIFKFGTPSGFAQVGSYNTQTGDFDINVSALNSIRYTSSHCPGACSECLYLYGMQPYMYEPGDVLIGGVFNIHNEGSTPFTCGEIRDENGYLYSEAVSFALMMLKSGKAPVSLSDVSLGGLVLDACESSLRASNLVSSIYSGAILLGENDDMVDVTHIKGWATSDNALSIEISDILDRLGIPLVSSSGTISGENADFFRTVPTDDRLAQGILKLVKYFKWEYVQTINSADMYGQSGIGEFIRIAATKEICILSSYEIGTHGSAQDILKNLLTSSTSAVVIFANKYDTTELMKARAALGSASQNLIFITSQQWDTFTNMNVAVENTLSFSINSPTIEEFDIYMATKYIGQEDSETNPWFRAYYEAVFQCDLGTSTVYQRPCSNPTSSPITSGMKYEQDAQVLPTVNAIYALVGALDLALKEVCGQSYSGLCDDFTSDPQAGEKVMSKLPDVLFTSSGVEFRFQDKMYDEGYNIYRTINGQNTLVAIFATGSLKLSDPGLSDSYKDVSVTCGGSCLQCRYSHQSDEQFTYIPGDILLAGVFDVHMTGDNPFECGAINTQQGYQLLEAFNYAIQYVNDKKGMFKDKFKGITLGGIGLDACKSATRAGNLVANVHSGFLPLKSANSRIDPDRINVYIGPYGSDMSARVSEVLNVIGIPEISFGSTSVVFKDKQKYPYFLRTVPADDKLARAMVSILQRRKVEYVQVVNSPGAYGDEATSQFVQLAIKKGICVAQNITLYSNGDLTIENANLAVSSLLRKPEAKIVVTFINTDDIKILLKAVDTAPGADIFTFLGSDTWAEYQDLITGEGDTAKNAITLGVEQADLPDFDKYLESKIPGSYSDNPWFDEYYEAILQCSLTPGPNQCQQTDRPLVYTQGYKQDPYVLYTVNAVFSAALGIDYAVKKNCGDNYLGLCEDFRNSGKRRQTILEGIRQVMFEDTTEVAFSFTSEGESNRGYHIFTVKETLSGDSFYYDHVGSYNDTHGLKVITELTLEWPESNCDGHGSCNECPTRDSMRTRYAYQPSPENLNIISYFDVHHANADNNLACGSLNKESGFPSVLAFFYAIDQINQNEGIQLPTSIRLGGAVIDTCSNNIRVTQDTFSLLLGEGLCGTTSTNTIDPSSVVVYMPSGSSNADAAAALLSPRKITTLNPSIHSMNKQGHSYYLQTSPSDMHQAQVLAAIAYRFGWSYASVVYSDTDSGRSIRDSFMSITSTSAANLCVGKNVSISSNPSMQSAEMLVRSIDSVPGSNAIILFTTPEQTRMILQAAQSLGLHDRFIWLGSDAWGTNKDIVEGLSDIARGAMTVDIWSEDVNSFVQYVTGLTVVNHGMIPDDWFEEFWQLSLECRLENSSVPQQLFTRNCQDSDRLTPDMVTQGPAVLQVIISTYMTAQGLNSIEECTTSNLGVAGCLGQLQNRHDLIYNSIKGADWTILPGEINPSVRFQFTPDGYGNIGYNIYNYRRTDFQDDNSYGYVKVGQWKGSLSVDTTLYYAYVNGKESSGYPTSKCPTASCSCENYNNSAGGPNNGQGSGNGGGKTDGIPGLDMKEYFYDTWGIIVAALTAVGLICTICSFVYLLIFYPIRGGTTILGYLLLFGVLLMYSLVFAFILHADVNVCGIRRFGIGFVYAVCFSAMIIKVLNNWRVGSYYGDYGPPTYERIAHPCSLFWIAAFLIIVQSIIGIEWLVLDPPEVETIFYQNRNIPRCSPADFHTEELIISCAYVMMMIMVTLIFSAVTWDSEENHRESRWILIASCFTIGVWLVWTVISTMTEIKYREPAIAIALLVNASAILLCIFVRKIYLLVKYQKEIEEERKSQYAASTTSGIHDSDVKENGLFSTLYPNQVFHVDQGYEPSGDPAQTNSGIMYLYEDGTTVGGDIEF